MWGLIQLNTRTIHSVCTTYKAIINHIHNCTFVLQMGHQQNQSTQTTSCETRYTLSSAPITFHDVFPSASFSKSDFHLSFLYLLYLLCPIKRIVFFSCLESGSVPALNSKHHISNTCNTLFWFIFYFVILYTLCM